MVSKPHGAFHTELLNLALKFCDRAARLVHLLPHLVLIACAGFDFICLIWFRLHELIWFQFGFDFMIDTFGFDVGPGFDRMCFYFAVFYSDRVTD